MESEEFVEGLKKKLFEASRLAKEAEGEQRRGRRVGRGGKGAEEGAEG